MAAFDGEVSRSAVAFKIPGAPYLRAFSGWELVVGMAVGLFWEMALDSLYHKAYVLLEPFIAVKTAISILLMLAVTFGVRSIARKPRTIVTLIVETQGHRTESVSGKTLVLKANHVESVASRGGELVIVVEGRPDIRLPLSPFLKPEAVASLIVLLNMLIHESHTQEAKNGTSRVLDQLQCLRQNRT